MQIRGPPSSRRVSPELPAPRPWQDEALTSPDDDSRALRQERMQRSRDHIKFQQRTIHEEVP